MLAHIKRRGYQDIKEQLIPRLVEAGLRVGAVPVTGRVLHVLKGGVDAAGKPTATISPSVYPSPEISPAVEQPITGAPPNRPGRRSASAGTRRPDARS